MLQHFNPPTLYPPDIYSQAVKGGRIVVAAGQCATAPDRTVVGVGDPHVQARQSWQNLKTALEAAGASMRDVVKVTNYSTHPEHRRILDRTRLEFFEPPYPASSGVVITGLARPEFLFEVEAIAVAGEEGRPLVREHINPPTLYRPVVYSQVVKVGNLIFVAGQCANVPDGPSSEPSMTPTIAGVGDPYVQARQCYQNVRLALEAAGASMRHVVKINTYSTHDEYRKILIDLRREFFEPPYPASTGVVVTSLYSSAALFEVEAIAIVDT